jgi:hypothetical protein
LSIVSLAPVVFFLVLAVVFVFFALQFIAYIQARKQEHKHEDTNIQPQGLVSTHELASSLSNDLARAIDIASELSTHDYYDSNIDLLDNMTSIRKIAGYLKNDLNRAHVLANDLAHTTNLVNALDPARDLAYTLPNTLNQTEAIIKHIKRARRPLLDDSSVVVLERADNLICNILPYTKSIFIHAGEIFDSLSNIADTEPGANRTEVAAFKQVRRAFYESIQKNQSNADQNKEGR